jgi:LysM repeat protein
MAERGLPIVDGAAACPFVAFDDERDERATSPDHRHRCYAETPPAPRALAHQEAYCLSSAFPVCPTFQDWARREAAQARPGGAPLDDGEEVLPPLAAERPPRRSGPHTWSAPPPWLRGSPSAPTPPQGLPSQPGATSPGLAAPSPAPGRAAATGGLAGSFADRLLSRDQPAPPSPEPEWIDRDAWDDDAEADRGTPAAGAGVAGAAGAGAAVAAMEELPAGRRREHERVDGVREDPRARELAPAWERPRRLEAYPTLRSRRLSAGFLPPLLLGVLAVVLVAGALFFLPSLLGIGGGPGAGGASPSPSVAASVPVVSLAPTIAPAPTPFLYTVKAGDTMSRIAKRFGVPLADLIAANTDTIKNPDSLQIGDQVIIPTATPSSLPAASQP